MDYFEGSYGVCLEVGTEYIPYEVTYNSCDEPYEECSSRTPDCRSVASSQPTGTAAMCTRLCDEDADCPAPSGYTARCVAVGLDGQPEPGSAEKLCFLNCQDGWCSVGSDKECRTFNDGADAAIDLCVPRVW